MRGREHIVEAVILSRSEHREADRVVFAYTDLFGKVPVRFSGVNRAEGKLKALSEPMVWTELRLYVRHGAEFCTATGGALISTFPRLRRNLHATVRGLEVCELLRALTPTWRPNPEKIRLASDFLSEMDRVPASAAWLSCAFALRLLESAGYGLSSKKVSDENAAIWRLLHEAPPEEVSALPQDPSRIGRLDALIRHSAALISEAPVRTIGFLSEAGVRTATALEEG